ncbi:MAG: hypothetical protein AAFY72_03020 [Cyanobacteria bacterium J06649_4]
MKIVDGKPTGTVRAPSSYNWRNPYLWDFSLLNPAEYVDPDIGIYVYDTGSNYRCTSPVLGTRIEDTLACVFVGVEAPSSAINLAIIDYDISEHDLIGEGSCSIGQTCSVGQAEVTILEVPCKDPEIQVSYPSSAEYRRAYRGVWIFDGIGTELFSGYHLYPPQGELIESRVCSTDTTGCTREMVFETMLSQTRFIAPKDDSSTVTNCKITVLDIPYIPAGDDPIRTVIDPTNFSITNYTRYDHALHSGRVTRMVLERDGFIVVSTSGEGYGLFPTENVRRAPALWKEEVDAGLVEAVQTVLLL